MVMEELKMLDERVSMISVMLIDRTVYTYRTGEDGVTCICVNGKEIRIKQGNRLIHFVKRNIQSYLYEV